MTTRTESYDAVVAAHVTADRDRMLEHLRELVRVETPTGDAAAIERVGDTQASRWSQLGGRTQVHVSAGGPHYVTDVPGRGRLVDEAPLLLVTHLDTVHPTGSIDGPIPYVVEADAAGPTVVRGPGTYDMKAGVVVIEAALRALAELPDQLPVRILSVADEEIGSPSSRELIVAAAAGCRGAIGFESPHPDGSLKVGRYGSTRVRIDVTGRAAHAALDPERGVSAVDELVDQLLALRKVVARVLADAPGSTLLNVGRVEGGQRANVVPDRAWAEVGLRFRDPAAEGCVLAGIDALGPVRPGAVVATTVLSSRPTWLADDADHSFHAWLRDRSREVPTGEVARGASDCNLLGAAGVPCVDGFGPRGRGAHAVDEQIQVASLLDRAVTLARILCH